MEGEYENLNLNSNLQIGYEVILWERNMQLIFCIGGE